MQLYRLVAALSQRAARGTAKGLVHALPGSTDSLVTERTLTWLAEQPGGAGFKREPVPFQPPAEEWARAQQRLRFFLAARIADPLPVEVADEVHLYLLTHPQLSLEYVGRGRFANEKHLPEARRDLYVFEVVDGNRSYLFRRIDAEPGSIDQRMQRISARYTEIARWLNDPTARLVLAVGGGGFRLFAATPVLRVLDQLLHSRAQIAEVWGSGGAALLSYVYAAGFDPSVVDELGYSLYHQESDGDGWKNRVMRWSVWGSGSAAAGKSARPSLAAWLAQREAKQPAAERPHPLVPFFATVGGARSGGRIALTEEQQIPACCPELFRASDGGLAVTEAAHDEDDEPFLLPYLKWMRERATAPDVTPPRLKICYVNLLSRAVDRPGVQLLANAPLLGKFGVVQRAAEVFDILHEARGHAALQHLLEGGQVEVMTVRMAIDAHGADAGEIPLVIDSGRSFDTWEISMSHRGF